jgi:hypothetical protein
MAVTAGDHDIEASRDTPSELAKPRLVATAVEKVYGRPDRRLERLALSRIIQRGSGMDTDDDSPSCSGDPGVVHRSGFGRDADRPAEKVFGRDLSEGNEHRRVDGIYLPIEIRSTVAQFLVGRIAVVGRSAPDTVGDTDITSGESLVPKRFLEYVAGAANEWLALLVFLPSGGFADEKQIRVWGTDTVDDAAPGGTQRVTAGAIRHVDLVCHVRSIGVRKVNPAGSLGSDRPVPACSIDPACEPFCNAKRLWPPSLRVRVYDLGRRRLLEAERSDKKRRLGGKPTTFRERVVRLKSHSSFLTVECFGDPGFEPVAFLEGDGHHGTVEGAVDGFEVDDVVPRRSNTGNEEVSNVGTVESIPEVDNRVGCVTPTDSTTAESEIVDGPIGADHGASDRARRYVFCPLIRFGDPERSTPRLH